VGAFTTWDLQGSWNALKNLQFVVGARNLTDRNPNLYIQTANLFSYGFDPSIYDPRGRVVYGRVVVNY